MYCMSGNHQIFEVTVFECGTAFISDFSTWWLDFYHTLICINLTMH